MQEADRDVGQPAGAGYGHEPHGGVAFVHRATDQTADVGDQRTRQL